MALDKLDERLALVTVGLGVTPNGPQPGQITIEPAGHHGSPRMSIIALRTGDSMSDHSFSHIMGRSIPVTLRVLAQDSITSA